MKSKSKIQKIIQDSYCPKTGGDHNFRQTYIHEELICCNCGFKKIIRTSFSFYFLILEKPSIGYYYEKEKKKKKQGSKLVDKFIAHPQKKKKLLYFYKNKKKVFGIKKIPKDKRRLQHFSEKYEVSFKKQFFDRIFLKVNDFFFIKPPNKPTKKLKSQFTKPPEKKGVWMNNQSEKKIEIEFKEVYGQVLSHLINEIFGISYNLCIFCYGNSRKRNFILQKKQKKKIIEEEHDFEDEQESKKNSKEKTKEEDITNGILKILIEKICKKGTRMTKSKKTDIIVKINVQILEVFEGYIYDGFGNGERIFYEKAKQQELNWESIGWIIDTFLEKCKNDQTNKIILITITKFDERTILLNNTIGIFYLKNMKLFHRFKNNPLSYIYKKVSRSKRTRTIFFCRIKFKRQ